MRLFIRTGRYSILKQGKDRVMGGLRKEGWGDREMRSLGVREKSKLAIINDQ